MKNILFLMLVCLLFALSTIAYIFYPYSILSLEDLLQAYEDNKRPALSFPETGKKFYNQWHCFESQSLKSTITKIDYDGWKTVPTLYLGDSDQRIEFTLDPDVDWDVAKIMPHWKELLNKSKYSCLFSVHLQSGPEGEVRYVERFKTTQGTWERDDDKFLLQ
jgi:hypothetical protein